MEEQEFKSLDVLAEQIDSACADWLESDSMAAVKDAIATVARALPAGHSLELAVELRVFDANREKSVRVLSAGLACQPGEEPYRVTGDSTPQRYLCNGELCELPHDYCPQCWGVWDFKWDQPVCPQCGCRLGAEVKVLLDRDLCPQCEKGRISMNSPVCSKCGFEVNPEFVWWG